MVEDAVHFLSKETVVQAIARSATKVRPLDLLVKVLIFTSSFDTSFQVDCSTYYSVLFIIICETLHEYLPLFTSSMENYGALIS